MENNLPVRKMEERLIRLHATEPTRSFVDDLERQLTTRASRSPSLWQKAALGLTVFTRGHPMLARSLVALGILFVVLFAGLSTEPGRALAQQILRFFYRGESDVWSYPTQGITLVPVTPGAEKPLPTPTITKNPVGSLDCGSPSEPECSVGQIQAFVPFPVKILAALPGDLKFIGAVLFSEEWSTGEKTSVNLVYRSEKDAYQLIISEVQWGSGEPSAVEVGASAEIQDVLVGKYPGQYLKGAWNGSNNMQWENTNAIRTLQWKEEDILLDLYVFAAPDAEIPWLTVDELVRIAASMVPYDETMDASLTTPPDKDRELKLAEVEAAAGYPVLTPASLPDGYAFDHALFSSARNCVCLYYQTPLITNNPVYQGFPLDPPLVIIQSPTAALPTDGDLSPRLESETMDIAEVSVGGAEGGKARFVSGDLKLEHWCGGYSQMGVNAGLLWTSGGKSFQVYFSGGMGMPGLLGRLDLIRIAESMTGVSTVPADQLDPEHLRTIDEVRRAAWFTPLFPTLLPEGVTFWYSIITEEFGPKRLGLWYDSYLFLEAPVDDPGMALKDEIIRLYEFPPDALEPVLIDGEPGYHIHGVYEFDESGNKKWMTDDSTPGWLFWRTRGIQIEISFFRNPVEPYTKETKETLIRIAESMK
jgi:hypothetical protein